MKLQQLLSAGDLFDEISKEQEIAERKFNILDNKQKELFDIFGQWNRVSWRIHSPMNYNLAVNLIRPKFFYFFPKNKRYDAQSIEDFLINLFKHKDLPSNSGLFISALINTSNDEYFRIFNYSNVRLDWLGYKNTKQISINGDIGHCLGSKMRKGKIVLNGNAESSTATYMRGGEIIINGHTDPLGLCHKIKGGSVYLNDKLNFSSSLYFIKHGRIYHNGKLIFKNGRRVK